MARVRLRHIIQALQQQHDELNQEVARLKQTQRALLLRQAILSTWVETLSRIQSITQVFSAEDEDVEEQAQQAVLLEEKVQLLAASAGLQKPWDAGLAALVQHQPDMQTIAPCTNPMAHLHGFLSMPVSCAAATMTAEQYAGMMQKASIQLSLKLHKLKCCSALERAGRLNDLADAWNR